MSDLDPLWETEGSSPGALGGLRVLDLSTYLPGPYATMLLADMGATVVHVEPPQGDPARHMPQRVGADSALHWWVGRNKRSLVLDLKQAEQRARLLEAVATADVVVEGFRPGVAARLGVDYDACRRAREDIVYCAISSYGQQSPHASLPAHDLNYAAKSGMLGLTRDDAGAPVLVGFPVTDVAGGLHAAVAILAALRHHDQTGEGQFIDIGVLAASVGLVGMQLMKHLGGATPRHGEDMNLGGDPAYGVYRSKDDRYLSIACLEPKFWTRLCDLLDLPELEPLRATDPAKVRQALEEAFARENRDHWDALLGEDADVCYGPVHGIDEVAEDADVVAADLLTSQHDADGRIQPQLASPIRMSATPVTVRTPAPRLGQ